MKKVIFTCVVVGILLVTWFDLLYVDAQIIAKQIPDVGVNPQKAVICAVIAGVTGIIIFLWRRKDNFKKKYKY